MCSAASTAGTAILARAAHDNDHDGDIVDGHHGAGFDDHHGGTVDHDDGGHFDDDHVDVYPVGVRRHDPAYHQRNGWRSWRPKRWTGDLRGGPFHSVLVHRLGPGPR
jgi:hypothetical protein